MIWKSDTPEKKKEQKPDKREPHFYFLRFKIPEVRIPELVQSWLKGLWLAPSGFSEKIVADNLKRVYVPFWLFKVGAKSTYSFQTLETHSGRWVQRNGTATNTYIDVLICALADLKGRQFLTEMENWQITEGERFEKCYSEQPPASLHCEKCLDLKTTWDQFTKNLLVDKETQYIESVMKQAATGSQLRNVHIEPTFPDIEHRLIYIPVYLSSYSYNNNFYRIAINGINGTVHGERPYWLGPLGAIGHAGFSYLGKTILG